MDNNSRLLISPKQFIFMIVGSLVGTGILSLPRLVAEEASQNGWIIVIGGAIIPATSVILLVCVCNRNKNMTLVEIAEGLLGNVLGKFLSLLFILYTFSFNAVILRIFTEIISMYLLPTTPLFVIALVATLTVVYITTKGIKVIARLNELTFYILILLLLLLLPSLSVANPTNILPVGQMEIGKLLKGMLITGFAYSGTGIIFIIYPMVTKKKNLLKKGLLAIGLVMIIYLIISVIGIMVFGPEAIERVIFPLIVIQKVTDIEVIERLELFFLMFWISISLRPIINYSYAGSFLVSRLLKLKYNTSFKYITYVYGLIIFILSLLIDNISVVLEYSSYVGYMYLVFGLGYPFLFYILTLIKQRIKQNA